MRRILIDDEIRALASSYKDRLKLGLQRNYKSPQAKLKELLNLPELDETQKRYVRMIIAKWDELILVEPPFKSVIEDFEQIYKADEVSRLTIKNGEKKEKKFYKMIVDAMRYDYVQESIYANVMDSLGIRTCVYCNAQYAFSYSFGKKRFINYELDHWLPKSKYPYLCTSFYNLQPSCPKCNKSKLDEDTVLPFCLYTHYANKLYPFKFSIDNESCAQYLLSHNRDVLRIAFASDEDGLKENMEQLFGISHQYQAHKDIAEEILWKSKIYNKTILDIYQDSFKELGFRKSDFNRFVLSNYDREEDILKRPLSKMMQDIAKQLGIIK